MQNNNSVEFKVSDEILSGVSVGQNPQLLFLHGAGGANKQRAEQLAERIVKETQQGAFLFDFSGHGQSSGELSKSSLKKRVDEANAAWQFLAVNKPITVFGFSMGGHIALELLKTHHVENLILFYPGIYTHQAFELPFDERFSQAIRQENSWYDANVLENLREYTGNLLIIWGENDEVVSRGVVDRIYETAENARSRELIIVPNGGHLLLPQIYDDAKLLNQIVREITSLCQSQS